MREEDEGDVPVLSISDVFGDDEEDEQAKQPVVAVPEVNRHATEMAFQKFNTEVAEGFGLTTTQTLPEWALSADDVKLAAYESLILCVLGSGHSVEEFRLEISGIGLNLGYTTAASAAVSSSLVVDDSGGMSRFGPERPYLHFRFLLILSRRPHHFGHFYLFKRWLLRQLKVFVAGLTSIVRRTGLEPWTLSGSEWTQAEAEFLLIGSFKHFYHFHIASCSSEQDFDEKAYNMALGRLNTTVWSMYACLAESDIHPEAMEHKLRYPYPLNAQMYENLVRGCFEYDPQLGTYELAFNLEQIEGMLVDMCKPLGISRILHEVAFIKVAFKLYMQVPSEGLMDFICSRVVRLPDWRQHEGQEQGQGQGQGQGHGNERAPRSFELEYLHCCLRLLDYLNRRLQDLRSHFSLALELLDPEVRTWKALREKLTPLLTTSLREELEALLSPFPLEHDLDSDRFVWSPELLKAVRDIGEIVADLPSRDRPMTDSATFQEAMGSPEELEGMEPKPEVDVAAVRKSTAALVETIVANSGGWEGVVGAQLKAHFGLPDAEVSKVDWVEVHRALCVFSEEDMLREKLDDTALLLRQFVMRNAHVHYAREKEQLATDGRLELKDMATFTQHIIDNIRIDKMMVGVFQSAGCDDARVRLVGLYTTTRLFYDDLKEVMGRKMTYQQKIDNLFVAVGMHPNLQELRKDLGLTPYHELLSDGGLFKPLVEAWLEHQHIAFANVLTRVLANERFVSLSADTPHSDSIVQLVGMFTEKVKFFLELPLPHDRDGVAQLARSITLQLGKYANFVMKFTGNRNLPAHLTGGGSAPVAREPEKERARSADRRNPDKRSASNPGKSSGGGKPHEEAAGRWGMGLFHSNNKDAIAAASETTVKYFSNMWDKTKEIAQAGGGAQGSGSGGGGGGSSGGKKEDRSASLRPASLAPVVRDEPRQDSAAAHFAPSTQREYCVMLFNIQYAIDQMAIVRRYTREKFLSLEREEGEDLEASWQAAKGWFNSTDETLAMVKDGVLDFIASDLVWTELQRKHSLPVGEVPLWGLLYSPLEAPHLSGIKCILKKPHLDDRLADICSIVLEHSLELRQAVVFKVFFALCDALVKVFLHPDKFRKTFECSWNQTTIAHVSAPLKKRAFWRMDAAHLNKRRVEPQSEGEKDRVLRVMGYVAEDLFQLEQFMIARNDAGFPAGLQESEAALLVQPIREMFHSLLFAPTHLLIPRYFEAHDAKELGLVQLKGDNGEVVVKVNTRANLVRILTARHQSEHAMDFIATQLVELIDHSQTPTSSLVDIFLAAQDTHGREDAASVVITKQNIGGILRTRKDVEAIKFRRLLDETSQSLVDRLPGLPELFKEKDEHGHDTIRVNSKEVVVAILSTRHGDPVAQQFAKSKQ